jgi:hypothetical protein
LAESAENRAESKGVVTPVPTVAMDCGLLESRFDRLDASNLQGEGLGFELNGLSGW